MEKYYDEWIYRGDDYKHQDSKIARFLAQINRSGPNIKKGVLDEYKEKSLNMNEILNHIPDYGEENFKLKLFEIFEGLVISIYNNKNIRMYTTDEFYNFIISSKIKGFDKIKYNKVLLNNVIKEDNLLYIHTNIIFVIDDKKLCNYDVVFSKSIEEKITNCPNCGSVLNDKATIECPYCKAIIISNKNNYVISNMKMEY